MYRQVLPACLLLCAALAGCGNGGVYDAVNHLPSYQDTFSASQEQGLLSNGWVVENCDAQINAVDFDVKLERSYGKKDLRWQLSFAQEPLGPVSLWFNQHRMPLKPFGQGIYRAFYTPDDRYTLTNIQDLNSFLLVSYRFRGDPGTREQSIQMTNLGETLQFLYKFC